jgi:hypothetical protein
MPLGDESDAREVGVDRGHGSTGQGCGEEDLPLRRTTDRTDRTDLTFESENTCQTVDTESTILQNTRRSQVGHSHYGVGASRNAAFPPTPSSPYQEVR